MNKVLTFHNLRNLWMKAVTIYKHKMLFSNSPSVPCLDKHVLALYECLRITLFIFPQAHWVRR
jgi:hypothetical protein